MKSAPALSFSLVGADVLAIGGGFVLSVLLTAAVSFLLNRHHVEAAPSQPVEFNHRLHVEDEGLECSSCHQHYLEETSSGLPPAVVCALCHLEPLGESVEELKLVSLLERGMPLEWDSAFRQPPHVFFSHMRHVAVADIECAACHGDVGSSESSPRERLPLAMDNCIACHEREAVTNACTSCHR
jgi:hypothetical protein